MFTGREYEIEALKECFEKDKNCISVLYGRQGIGKTEVVKVFCTGKTSFYYNCTELSGKEQFKLLRESIIHFLKKIQTDINAVTFYQYEENELYNMLIHACVTAAEYADGKLCIVIDEFQNIIKCFPSFATTLVKLTKDVSLKGRLNVILLSSSIRWIETDMAQDIGAAALAFSKIIKMKEFGLVDIMKMYNELDIDTCMMIYSVFGGIPKYLRFYNSKLTFEENLLRLCVGKNSIFSEEPVKILKSDLRELSLYNTLLLAIAQGDAKLNDLHERTGFSRAKISVYLKNLIDIDIVEKVYSYDTGVTGESQKGIYNIKDNIIAFWYRCILPNKSFIEFSDNRTTMSLIKNFDTEQLFEENYRKICGQYIELLASYGKIDFNPVTNETWYGKDGKIDIIMKDDKNDILVALCKWNGRILFEDYNLFYENLGKIKIKPLKIVLFSKDGIEDKLQTLIEADSKVTYICNSQF